MKLALKFMAAFLTIMVGAVICVAQESGSEVIGFRCPDSESGQPRPEVKIRLGDITKKALELPQPRYPREAKAAGISGDVHAEVVVDMSNGRVVWARIIDGHPLLQEAVKKVVCLARFSYVVTSGQPMKVSGILTYKFRKSRRFRPTSHSTRPAPARLSSILCPARWLAYYRGAGG